MEQSVLAQDEFQEQKHLVVDSLWKLAHYLTLNKR